MAKLGEGSFGVVWKETLIAGESQCSERAVKMIRKRSQGTESLDYSRELETIAIFSHPKVGACSRDPFLANILLVQSLLCRVIWVV
jgi:hypothetical protein